MMTAQQRPQCDNAWANVEALRDALEIKGLILERVNGRDWEPGDDGLWHFAFRLRRGRRKVIVHMPGCSLKELTTPSSRTRLQPQLCLNESSFWWTSVIALARQDLAGTQETADGEVVTISAAELMPRAKCETCRGAGGRLASATRWTNCADCRGTGDAPNRAAPTHDKRGSHAAR